MVVVGGCWSGEKRRVDLPFKDTKVLQLTKNITEREREREREREHE